MSEHSLNRGYRWIVNAIGGCFLVALGGALTFDQLGYAIPYRWLFLILLVPATSAFIDSFRAAKVVGCQSIQPLSRFIVGVVFALIGILASLRLNTGLILPALIVALGAATVARAVLGRLA